MKKIEKQFGILAL